jgi:hypothetical protein
MPHDNSANAASALWSRPMFAVGRWKPMHPRGELEGLMLIEDSQSGIVKQTVPRRRGDGGSGCYRLIPFSVSHCEDCGTGLSPTSSSFPRGSCAVQAGVGQGRGMLPCWKPGSLQRLNPRMGAPSAELLEDAAGDRVRQRRHYCRGRSRPRHAGESSGAQRCR